MKRIFIVHGWGGYPAEGWFPWIKKRLEQRKFTVHVLSMPHSEKPIINEWVPFLRTAVGTPDKFTYFIGHSIGCQTILRYLETVQIVVGGAVLVAPWFTLTGLTQEDKQIAHEWLETPIAFNHIKKIAKIQAIFSDNDPFVPLDNIKLFEQKLSAVIILEYQKGHIGGEDSILELPSALDATLKLSNE